MITICIPLYNSEEYIRQTIDSIKNQSFKNWNCIIVDDDSHDNSVELTLKLIKYDKRFSFLKRTNYSTLKGANVCRNIALDHAVSEWVMFVDSDDYLDKDCLKNRFLEIFNNLGYDFYIFKTAFVNQNGEIIGYFNNPNNDLQDLIYRFVYHQIPWHTMSNIWSASFLKIINGWNEDYERLQDVELNIRALLCQPKIYFSKENVDSFYRYETMSLDKKQSANMGFCKIVRDFYPIIINSNILDDNYKERVHDVFQLILENQLRQYAYNYILNEKWEKLYLDTMKKLDMDKKEINFVLNTFKKLKTIKK